MYDPPATQFPAGAHDTELTMAYPSLFRASRPGTLIAWPQAPLLSLTTNPWNSLWSYHPPASQLPGDAHDTELTFAVPLMFSAPRPGTSIARPQRPFFSLTTNPR